MSSDNMDAAQEIRDMLQSGMQRDAMSQQRRHAMDDNLEPTDTSPAEQHLDQAIQHALEPLEKVRIAMSEIDALADAASHHVAAMIERDHIPQSCDDVPLRRLEALLQRLSKLTERTYEQLRGALENP